MKRSRSILYKRSLSALKRRTLERFLSYSTERREAYESKESFVKWFDEVKKSNDRSEVEANLL